MFRERVMFLHKITFLRQLFLPRFKRKFKISVAGNHTKQNITVLCVANFLFVDLFQKLLYCGKGGTLL